ncbi:MAG: SLATT domain-containing protein [Candidatus Latescibacteria bacterium]|nr:SLATT domain-containing protein [Candidatus Latescibacterota bacterium]
MATEKEFPLWDQAKPAESLMLVYQWTIQKARAQIHWYENRRWAKRVGSQWLRILTILFTAIGALCPLIDATKIVQNTLSLGQWGYVSLALAAAFVSYDRYFGLSTGWMRNIITQMSLEKALNELQYDWAILLAQHQGLQPPQDRSRILLQRLKEFSLQVDALVRQETDAWVTEFQSNLAELEKLLKTEVETRKLGSIKVTVTNAREFERVALQLNESQVKEIVGVTEGILDRLPPGHYEITAISKKGDKEVKDSKVVEVQPNTMTSVDLTLPAS